MKNNNYIKTMLVLFVVLIMVVLFLMPCFISLFDWENWFLFVVLPIILGIIASMFVSLWFTFLQQIDYKKRQLRYEIHEQLTYYNNAIDSIVSINESSSQVNFKILRIRGFFDKKFFVEYIDREYRDLYDKKINKIREINKYLDNLTTINQETISFLSISVKEVFDILLEIQQKFFKGNPETL